MDVQDLNNRNAVLEKDMMSVKKALDALVDRYVSSLLCYIHDQRKEKGSYIAFRFAGMARGLCHGYDSGEVHTDRLIPRRARAQAPSTTTGSTFRP
jgi:hypothetical protein